MASGGSTITHGGVADRYARALYSSAEDASAQDPGTIDSVVDEMVALGQLIDTTPALRQMLASPLIDARQALAGLRAALEASGFSPLIIRFAGVVAVNRRLTALRTIVSAFGALVAEKRGVVSAEVTTAYALTDVQREALRARLIEAGYARVNIAEEVDPALLGGLVVRIGARLFDSSIKSRLQRLQYAMKGAA